MGAVKWIRVAALLGPFLFAGSASAQQGSVGDLFGAATGASPSMPAVDIPSGGASPVVIPGPSAAPPQAEGAQAAAIPVPGKPQVPWSIESCKPIYKDRPVDLRNKMFSFEPVYGKRSILWTEEDYSAVAALAQACSGVVLGAGDRFNANGWTGMVNQTRNRLLPVAQVAREIFRRAEAIKPDQIHLPPCEKLLDFKFNAYEGSDSSKEMFGLSYLAMSQADLERSVAYVNLCLAYLPDYAQIAGGWRKEMSRDLLNRIMDRALIVQKRRLEWEALPRYDTDLVLDLDGVVVPTTMTSPDAREMVARFNKSSALRRPFSPEAIGSLLRMSDEVLRDNRSAFDKLYAGAVKARCQQEIFRKQ